MSTIDLSSYKNLYLETGREFIVSLRKNIDTLNSDTANKAAIYEIFRSFHSLKSQSYAMGYTTTAEFCKLLEDYFHTINDGVKPYSQQLSPILLAAVTSIESSMDHIARLNSESDLTALSNSLKHKLA